MLATALLSLSLLGPQAPADTVRYTVLMAGRPAGVQKSWTDADGVRRFFFEYNDRGRGPRLEERVRLDASGVPTLLQTVGHGYLKDSVDERFSVASGRASWRSQAEKGEGAARG